MLGKREPVDMDIEAVLDAAAARGVFMEINAQPHRIDLCDLHARMAKERGIQLVISTDGHTLLEMDQMRYGIFAARRAGLEKGDVLNTLADDELMAAIRKKSGQRPAARKKPKARASRGHAKGGMT
jgi:DNA polymerase (family 10)